MRKHITIRTLEDARAYQYTLSDTAKITVKANGAVLKATTIPGYGIGYPQDLDISVKWPLTPGAATRLIMLDYSADIPEDCSLAFAIGDGTDRYYWNGAAWVVAAAGQWNTIADFNANLATWTATRDFELWVNLVTTDYGYTPTLYEIKLLWEGTFDYNDDLVYRTLKPYLAAVTAEERLAYTMTATTTTVDLSTFAFEAGYTISDVVEAYNHTDDPTHLTNILSSYNTGTGIATFTGAQATGKRIMFVFQFSPWVMISLSEDYTELEKVPAIIVSSFAGQNKRTRKQLWTVDRGTSVAWLSPDEVQTDFVAALELYSPTGAGIERLKTALQARAEDQPYLESAATGERWDLMLGEPMRTPSPRTDNLKAITVACTILRVGMLQGTWQQTTGVDTLNLSFINQQQDRIGSAETIVITE
jgi:hypothetical protein